MKRIAFWALPLLLIGALTTQGFAQDVKWKGTEYEDYMGVYNEKDNAKKAAGAEKYFVDHKDADPIALTQIYSDDAPWLCQRGQLGEDSRDRASVRTWRPT